MAICYILTVKHMHGALRANGIRVRLQLALAVVALYQPIRLDNCEVGLLPRPLVQAAIPIRVCRAERPMNTMCTESPEGRAGPGGGCVGAQHGMHRSPTCQHMGDVIVHLVRHPPGK
jgi:hypothetical protein